MKNIGFLNKNTKMGFDNKKKSVSVLGYRIGNWAIRKDKFLLWY